MYFHMTVILSITAIRAPIVSALASIVFHSDEWVQREISVLSLSSSSSVLPRAAKSKLEL